MTIYHIGIWTHIDMDKKINEHDVDEQQNALK